MKGTARVTLLGHLASDIEERQTKSGKLVVTFPVAVNRTTYDNNGEKAETADFHRVVAWDGLAGICSAYLSKGQAVFLEGRLLNRSYEDKTGAKRFSTEVVASDLTILTWKKRKENEDGEIEIQDVYEEEIKKSDGK